ncbi:hypothetical protein EVAR_85166_1 [Eumeta japonica]|uniref:Zinc finger BED domain-containing protein 4 n=1 Tax=Eumeta variegata TaxID=151549 RepID=A0A4C2A2Z5_EUMVA|nr:hypothetical protein EVAR_85166_1 [Eumeta japonica]
MQKQMNLPVLKLKQDVVTRWNSTYDMLNRVVSRKDAVIATLALVRHELALNTTEWQVVEEAIPILKSFYEVTTEISTEKQRIAKVDQQLSLGQKRLGNHRILRRQYGRNLTKKFPHVPCNPVAAGIVELDKYIQESLLVSEQHSSAIWDLSSLSHVIITADMISGHGYSYRICVFGWNDMSHIQSSSGVT